MPKPDTTDVVTEDVVEDENQTVDTVPELDDFIDVNGDLIANDPVAGTEELEESEDAPDEADAAADTADVATDTTPVVTPDSPGVATPAPVVPDDPGEFAPQLDYSFTITTTDGKAVTLNSPAEVDAFTARLDSEEGLISASQLLSLTRGAARMDVGIERERSDYQADKIKFDESQAADQARTDQLNQWSKELTYLRGKGLVPTPTKEADADWLAHKDDPGIKEAQAIFAWMDTENKARNEAGIAPITSAVDAYRFMQAEQVEEAEVTARSRAGDARRARGRQVTGAAPHIPDNTPANAIVGTGGNLRDLLYEAQNDM